MSAVLDAQSTVKSLTGTSTTITTLTVSGNANRLLLIKVLCGSQGVTFPAGFTITRDTGETFTLVPNTSFADSGLTGCGRHYALLNPSVGNVTITISWTGSNEMHFIAEQYSNVDQTSVAVACPNGTTVVHTTATASPITGPVTSAAGNRVASSFAQNVSSWGAISGTTTGTDSGTGPNLAVAFNTDPGAASVSPSAAFTGTSAWAFMAHDILAAAGGGGGTAIVAPPIRALGGRLKPQFPFVLRTIAPFGNPGTPTLVQIVGSTLNDNNGISGNAYQFNAPNVTLAGNCLILAIAYPFNASRTVSIADSTGDVWPTAAIITGAASAGNMNTRIYVLPNASAGMHTLTVTFDASLKPFQYTLAEFNNVAAISPVDGVIGANSVSGASANAGSFTPITPNDALGGHLIFSYAISNDTVGTLLANQASAISATNSAQLLHADNTCTIPSASAWGVQATNGSINPGFAFTQSTGTNFVVAAIALKAAAAGQAPAAGIRIVRLLHASVVNPQTGNNVILFPCDGNLRVGTMAAGNNLNVVNSVKDSNNSTGFTVRTNAAGESQVFESANQSANNANALTINLNAGEPQFSIHLLDITGADPSPFMNTSGFNGSAPASGTVFNDFPDHTPNANVPGLTIVQTGMGTAGPQFGFASGAPAGAVFDNVFYTGETDQDRMDNADPFGHVNFSTNAAQTWNWLLGAAGHGSTAFATAVSYKAASGNISANLTGAAAASAAGIFGIAIADALIGAGAVSIAGVFTDTVGVAMTGAAAAGAAGTFADAIADALAGAGATSAAGAFAETASELLSGAAAVSGAGAFADAVVEPLTGIAATVGAGTFADAIARAMSGAGAAAGAGTLSTSTGSGSNVSLPGASAAVNAGTFADLLALALSGAAANALAGGVATSEGETITGASAALAAGSMTPAALDALVGTAATASAGFLGKTETALPTGAQIAALAGFISPPIGVSLFGAFAHASAGILTVSTFAGGAKREPAALMM